MAKTDTKVSDLIINQLSYDDFSSISIPSDTEIYLVEENDISVCETIRPNRELISSYAMPGTDIINLTLVTSGETYTAPVNGYICLDKVSTASGQYIKMTCGYLKTTCYSTGSGQDISVFLPCRKGQEVTIDYTVDGTTNSFKFISCFGVSDSSANATDLQHIYNELHEINN